MFYLMKVKVCVFWTLFLLSLLSVSLFLVSCSPEPKKEPKLLSIQPSQSFQNKEVKVLIGGKNLPDGATLSVSNAEGKTYALKQILWVSATEIEAVFPSTVPAGIYDLVLKRKDGTSVLLGAAYKVLANVLTIYSIDVGQGDATLILSPTGKSMLIDTGRAREAWKLARFLSERGMKKLDHILVTHYDEDHVGGLQKVMSGKDQKVNTEDDLSLTTTLWDRGGWSKSKSYSTFRTKNASKHRSLSGKNLESFPSIDLGGGVKVKILTVNGVLRTKNNQLKKINCKSDENCMSIGTLIELGSFRFWTAGDLTGGGNKTPDMESALAREIGDVQVYRAHHHGSKTSSGQAFLRVLRPEAVLVSAGAGNRYCHPHTNVLERVINLPNAWFFMTSTGADGSKCGGTTASKLKVMRERVALDSGHIQITSDGNTFTIKALKTSISKTWDVN